MSTLHLLAGPSPEALARCCSAAGPGDIIVLIGRGCTHVPALATLQATEARLCLDAGGAGENPPQEGFEAVNSASLVELAVTSDRSVTWS